jgi:hypothetical protein
MVHSPPAVLVALRGRAQPLFCDHSRDQPLIDQGGPARCANTGQGLDRPPALDRRTTVTTIPPPEPRHSWNDLLRLVGAVRRLAYDRSLEPDDAMRRIRDAFGVYDGRIDDDPDGES